MKFSNQEILITKEQIAKRVQEIGKQITADYAGEEILLVGILKGAAPFMADLMREIDLDLTIDFMCVSSYGSATKTSGVVRIGKDLDTPIEGKNVIIVEDIVDSGLTLFYLKKQLLARNPKSLKVCTILDKPCRRKVEFKADYVGFEVDDKFIVGYGLDADQHLRQLPYISWVKEE
ncbi:MAG: hypoxanthine phosphoribosyltransferase [Clostridia bacterium]|nr:hypoxanthine phosphoribosyltransferase [Clostridia bacterium]